ncbi:SpoIIE family protein phosphatase [Flexithrix dorotheae]|uniref:SpoIIE family protein phosphatase n=1 Tax=Flexithrix dorotheae TaxID=70993 RepID=UPI00037A821D|nr:SpoIIE family protein phosphatase [Flexithrix dorotheae]
MENNITNPKRKLTISYVAALVVIGVLTILTQLIFHYVINMHSIDESIIDITREQIFLTERINNEANRLIGIEEEKEFSREMDNFKVLSSTWSQIQENLKDLEYSPIFPDAHIAEIRGTFQKMAPHYNSIKISNDEISKFYFDQREIDKESFELKINTIAAHKNDFQGYMEEISGLLKTGSELHKETVKKFQIGIFSANILVLLVLGLFIFKPVVSDISKHVNLIDKQNEEFEKLTSELIVTEEQTVEASQLLLDKNKELVSLKEQLESSLKSEQASKSEFEFANSELTSAYDEIQYKNKQINASINYAQRIQSALLPQLGFVEKAFPDSFILFKPKDVVSGDFYWFFQKDYKTIIAAVDCMGHGVPGAFMSLIGERLLYETVYIRGITEADIILNELHEKFKITLKKDITHNDDTLDIALCVIDNHPQRLELFGGLPKVEFAGARNPLIYIKDGEIHEIKGEKLSIGGNLRSGTEKFTKHVIELDTPARFYIFSDGYQDQFGGPGPRGKKFTKKRMMNLLLENKYMPITQQKDLLEKTLADWMAEAKEEQQVQIDDVLVIGFSVG